MLINEIPIEVRKINGVTKVLLRKYLIKWSGISLSTNLLLCVAYPHIKHNTKPVAAIIPLKDITTIL
jgi:hypothetical protein